MHHRGDFTEDIKHRAQLQVPGVELAFTDDMFNMVLIMIEHKVMELGRELASFGLPQTVHIQGADALSCEVLRETTYNIPQLADYVARNEPKL